MTILLWVLFHVLCLLLYGCLGQCKPIGYLYLLGVYYPEDNKEYGLIRLTIGSMGGSRSVDAWEGGGGGGGGAWRAGSARPYTGIFFSRGTSGYTTQTSYTSMSHD